MGYSIWDGLKDIATGGTYSMLKGFSSGSTNGTIVDGLSGGLGININNMLDPGNILWPSWTEDLSKDQFEMEKKYSDLNYNEQIRQNDWNMKMQQDAFNYQKSLNSLQMQREDDAVLRRVQDLKNAGLSPTLAAGSAAAATPVHAGTAPQGVAPQRMTPSDVRVRAAMFKEQMQRDRMQLALSVLGNMADISRTKAETEFISAQKDKLVGETPIDLRLKEIAQEYAESTNAFKIKQEELNMDYKELKNANEELSKKILENEVNIKAYEAVIKFWEAFYADRKEKSKTESLETDVKQKAVALQMSEFLHSKELESGIPVQMMSPKAKEFWNMYWSQEAQHKKPKVPTPDTSNHPLTKVFKKIAPYGWKSPSLLFRK